jgi:hypothetical protein
MANGYTLAEATTLRAAALANYTSTLNATEYEIGTRKLKRANPEALWREFDRWDRIVQSLGGSKLSPIVYKRVIPHDG